MSLSSDVHALATAIGVKIKAVAADVANKQALNPNLTAVSALTLAADKVIYATGAGAVALADLTAYARTLLDDTSASAARATLDVYSKAESSALAIPVALMGSAKLTAIISHPASATAATSVGYIAGLTTTVTGDGRPVKVSVHFPSIKRNTATNTFVYLYLSLNDVMVGLVAIKGLGTTDPGDGGSIEYLSAALGVGSSNRFNVGIYNPSMNGTMTIVAASNIPAELIVVRA